MNLKVLCVSFINLLVALAVNSANASSYDEHKFLTQSETAYANGKYFKSDYLIARYLGDEYANQRKVVDTIDKRIPKPTAYLNGSYSNKFLKFFFGTSLNQWRSKLIDKQNNILVKINSIEDQYVSVWGKPFVEAWYILHKHKKKQVAYTVGMHKAKIRIGPLSKEGKPLKPCDTFTINEPIQYFYDPMFLDTNDNGKNELLLRYNITLASGYIQVLDIFVPRIKDNYCHLSHQKSFYGRNGFAYYDNGTVFVSEETFHLGETSLKSSIQTETIYDPYGKSVEKRIIPNFLKTENISILESNHPLSFENPENMFHAFYMTCKIGQPRSHKNCLEVEDKQGPYKDEGYCKDRIIEMIKGFSKLKDPSIWEISGYLCEQKSIEELAEKWK